MILKKAKKKKHKMNNVQQSRNLEETNLGFLRVARTFQHISNDFFLIATRAYQVKFIIFFWHSKN